MEITIGNKYIQFVLVRQVMNSGFHSLNVITKSPDMKTGSR